VEKATRDGEASAATLLQEHYPADLTSPLKP
jgi:hypothetical protein